MSDGPIPRGEGLVARRLRIAKGDVYVLGGILSGEDHLASLHGERGRADASGRVIVSVVTTTARARELDAWLADLRASLPFELLP
ncbi:MAG: hypothetical protein RLO52_23255 [Sandaracinaceae bacterium]|nr:MAG: hypothetical protein EVA89_16620 [Sandaracinaceae bacterium]HBQ19272.1 hypothetical protein [Myxococcales bacterium]